MSVSLTASAFPQLKDACPGPNSKVAPEKVWLQILPVFLEEEDLIAFMIIRKPVCLDSPWPHNQRTPPRGCLSSLSGVLRRWRRGVWMTRVSTERPVSSPRLRACAHSLRREETRTTRLISQWSPILTLSQVVSRASSATYVSRLQLLFFLFFFFSFLFLCFFLLLLLFPFSQFPFTSFLSHWFHISSTPR